MSIGSNTYPSTTMTTQEITLEHELVVRQTGSRTYLEGWWNLAADANPEVRRVTILDAPVETAYFLVTIAGNQTKTFVSWWDETSPVDELAIAAELATLCNISPDVAAVVGTGVEANTFTLTAAEPGTNGAFTLTVACMSEAGVPIATRISEAQVTAAAGVGKNRKILEAEVELLISPQGFPGLLIKKIDFLSGATVPTVVGGNTLPLLPHNQRMDALRLVA